MDSSKSVLFRSAEETHKLAQVARGELSADLVLTNATVLNVYTGEHLKHHTVSVWDRWIAYVGNDPGASVGNETRVIDVDGKTVIPGFIDAHTHLAWLSTPAEFLKHAISGGTTTIVTETLEPYPISGLPGVIDFLQSIKDQPVKIFATAPPMVSTSSAAMGISRKDLQALMETEEIIGLGESYWQAVQQRPDIYLPILAEASRRGMPLEGHTAGASEKKLMGYLATGISSCHEPIKAEEALQRLRLGLHVMIREGSIRRDLEEIAKLKDMSVNLRRLILVSDGIVPDELLKMGYMEYIVQKAIDCGFDPIAAVQMATLNPAEHFRLDHVVGGIAPGRYADLLVVPDIHTPRAEIVISSGKIIARNGDLLVKPRAHTFTRESINCIRLNGNIEPADFRIPTAGGLNTAKVRIVDMVTDLVTRELVLEVPVRDDEVRIAPQRDILKIAAVERTGSPGKIFAGLIHGFGLRSGALACSAAWDTTNIIVAGADESDMALAVNRIAELKGGAVVCNDGVVLEELPLPIFGIMSDLPLEEINRRVHAVNAAAASLGVPFRDPVLSLITLTGAAIPFLRICEEGLVNLKDGKTMGLFVSE